ncbi:monocarboxylate transporter 4-like isoform X1 [Apostichopus japonicus]|uniref:monocarboxylate transporter 4-like isoform X1 n=1 Tax=Stichopus japonicus TaxID=307972 RepID=UPI003AB5B5F3
MEKVKICTAVTIRLFLNLGCGKALGVILNDTVSQTRGSLPFVALSFSILRGLSYVAAPFVIRLMRVFSSRSIVVVGGFLVGAGFIFEAFLANNSWLLLTSNIITGLGFGLSHIPLYIAVREVFDDSFGTAMSAICFTANIGMAVLPPLLEYLREKYGLAGALTLFGALMWNQILSGVLIQSRKSQSHTGKDSDEEGENSLRAPKQQKLSTPAYDSGGIYDAMVAHPTILCLYAAQLTHMFLSNSCAMFLIPYAVEKGYTQGEAVLLTTFGGCGMLLGRAVIGLVFYLKWQSRLIVMTSPIVLLMSNLLLAICTHEFVLLCFASGVIGFCLGYTSSWMFSYGKYITCLPHFNSTAAWSMICIGTAVISSGPSLGFVHDIRGTYDDVFILLILCAAVVAICTVACISLTKRNPDCDYGDRFI